MLTTRVKQVQNFKQFYLSKPFSVNNVIFYRYAPPTNRHLRFCLKKCIPSTTPEARRSPKLEAPQLEEWFSGDDEYIFMHDLAPCHKARSVTAFLAPKNIALLLCPGNSPDMNSIENMWELTKRAISKQEITTKNQLIETLTNEWNNNDDLKKMAKECIESMPRRIKAIIAAKGDITKY